jgi:hypothetical protein
MDTPGSGAELLVCVYYRVARRDSGRVISAVREFQRTLPPGVGTTRAQVLLRCDLPFAQTTSDAASAPSSPADPQRADEADATVMETYTLALPAPAASAAAQAVVHGFLRALDVEALALTGLLRGARHVELFAPCAS